MDLRVETAYSSSETSTDIDTENIQRESSLEEPESPISPSWVPVVPYPSRNTSMDILKSSNFDQILGPTLVGRKVQCQLLKQHSKGKFQQSFNLYLEEGGHPSAAAILTARKKIGSALPEYSIYADRDGSKILIGSIKSYALGTSFQIFQVGDDKSKTEIASVIYEPNFLGHHGPRKICVVIPAIVNGKRLTISSGKTLARMKKEMDNDVIVLYNKIPQWNEDTRSYVLNFNGRVSMASVKNFQIVHDKDLEYITMQFGKAENEFSIDLQYPFSLLQAFGIALTSFYSKVACE